jgi:hypothetical protein
MLTEMFLLPVVVKERPADVFKRSYQFAVLFEDGDGGSSHSGK